jgi:hypothetical protein
METYKKMVIARPKKPSSFLEMKCRYNFRLKAPEAFPSKQQQ